MLDWMFESENHGDQPGDDIEDAPFEIDPEAVPVERTCDNADYYDALTSVVDPELGINIADLGLVYALESRDHYLGVAISATTPACPMISVLVDDTREALESVADGRQVDVYLVWEPTWQPEFISEDAHRQLGGGVGSTGGGEL